MQKKRKGRKSIPARTYLKKHPQPVILHFQPTHFIPMKSPAELQQWEEMVRTLVGLGGVQAAGYSEAHTGTKCGDPTGIDYFDDCESD